MDTHGLLPAQTQLRAGAEANLERTGQLRGVQPQIEGQLIAAIRLRLFAQLQQPAERQQPAEPQQQPGESQEPVDVVDVLPLRGGAISHSDSSDSDGAAHPLSSTHTTTSTFA